MADEKKPEVKTITLEDIVSLEPLTVVGYGFLEVVNKETAEIGYLVFEHIAAKLVVKRGEPLKSKLEAQNECARLVARASIIVERNPPTRTVDLKKKEH